MGVHICLLTADGGEHPDWDWIRHAGDREFQHLVPSLPATESSEAEDWPMIRPADFKAWREAVAAVTWPNPGRFEHLLDILEREPGYWLHLSI